MKKIRPKILKLKHKSQILTAILREEHSSKCICKRLRILVDVMNDLIKKSIY
jgi:hypothetical protein